jgi:chitinase
MHCIFFVLIILQLSYAVHAIGASEKVVVGYWGYWESKLLPIEHIPWSQITHINYGFAPVNDDIIPNLSSKAQLSKIVDIAHQHHVKVLLSIGGLLGSKSMSKMASTEDNRTKFTKKIMEWVFEFGLDGIIYIYIYKRLI